MSASKLNVTLVGASILRESELPGFEAISDFASESYNLAIASIKASVDVHPELADRVRIDLADFDVSWDRKNLGEAEAQHVADLAPDVIGLSCYCWSLDTLLDLAQRLRARLPRAFIVLGGPSAGPDAERILRNHASVDAVVCGEGESTFASLLRARLAGDPLEGVAGLAWRRDAETVVLNELPAEPVDLTTLPSPYRTGVMRPAGSSLFLETSRGCRFRCRFCSWMGGGKRLRYVPIEQVEADLRWALKQGVRSVKLADTAINFHTERLAELAGCLRKIDPEGQLRLTYFLKPELLTQEQVLLLEGIPSDEIIIGVESLTPAARKAVGKPPFDAELFAQHMRWLSRVGPVTASFILGLPGDTIEGLDHTLDWMIRFDEEHPGWLHVICLFWLAVLPGASLHDKREALGLRLMPRETPYALEGHEHSPDVLLRMARRSIERHYGHPKVRVEYFHKEYLMQDAPREDRKVSIPRVENDDRPCVVLAGEVDPSWERSFRLRPYNLPIGWLKAYVETDGEVRRAWRIELVHLAERDGEAELVRLEAHRPSWLLWSVRNKPSSRLAGMLDGLRKRTGATLVLHGARTSEEAQVWLETVSAAQVATVGEAERAVLRLLRGEQDAPGLVVRRGSACFDTGAPELLEDLDAIPSPFQWGFVQRAGSTIAMQLGRQGNPPRTFGAERVYRDLRWAIEQRHDHVVWIDASLPNDPHVLQGYVNAARRADPGGKVRHTYRIDDSHTPQSVRELLPLPTRTVLLATADDEVRTEVERLCQAWGAQSVSEAPNAARLVASLHPLQRPGALPGWELRRIEAEPGGVVVELRWDRTTTVVVRLRQDPAETRQVKASVQVQGGSEPPQGELRRLTRVISALLQRARG